MARNPFDPWGEDRIPISLSALAAWVEEAEEAILGRVARMPVDRETDLHDRGRPETYRAIASGLMEQVGMTDQRRAEADAQTRKKLEAEIAYVTGGGRDPVA